MGMTERVETTPWNPERVEDRPQVILWGNRRLRLDRRQGTRVACARMAGFLPLRPARDHRTARNQARWLTEVGRLHLASGGSQQQLPSLYSEAFPRENVNVLFRIIKLHLPIHSVQDVPVPLRRQTFRFLQCLLVRSGPRIEHLKENRRRTSSIYSEALKKENVRENLGTSTLFPGTCSGAVASYEGEHNTGCSVFGYPFGVRLPEQLDDTPFGASKKGLCTQSLPSTLDYSANRTEKGECKWLRQH